MLTQSIDKSFLIDPLNPMAEHSAIFRDSLTLNKSEDQTEMKDQIRMKEDQIEMKA